MFQGTRKYQRRQVRRRGFGNKPMNLSTPRLTIICKCLDLILISIPRALRMELMNRMSPESQTDLYVVHTQCKSEWPYIAFENGTDIATTAHRGGLELVARSEPNQVPDKKISTFTIALNKARSIRAYEVLQKSQITWEKTTDDKEKITLKQLL